MKKVPDPFGETSIPPRKKDTGLVPLGKKVRGERERKKGNPFWRP